MPSLGAFNYWWISYEARPRGSIGEFSPVSTRAIKADDLEMALRFAREDLEDFGYEVRFPLGALRGYKSSILAIPATLAD